MKTFDELLETLNENEEYLVEYTAQDAKNHVGKHVVLGNSTMTKRTGKLENYKKLPDGRHALTINGMELHVSSHHPLLVNEEMEQLDERKVIVRFRNGVRQRKTVCGAGMKNVGNRCVRMSGTEKMHRRMGMRKAVRTKKRQGAGLKRRMNLKRQRTMRRRKAAGLGNH